MKLKQTWKRAIEIVSRHFDTRDLMFAAGLGAIAVGSYQVYAPAGLIVPGVIATGVSIFGVRS